MASKERKPLRRWEDYPIGTKAYDVMGGYWIKTERGWKWCTGDTFPRPGASVSHVETPEEQSEQRQEAE